MHGGDREGSRGLRFRKVGGAQAFIEVGDTIKGRDDIAKAMAPAQIDAARRPARTWKAKRRGR